MTASPCPSTLPLLHVCLHTCTRKCMRKSPAAVSSALVLRPRPEIMNMMMMAGSLMLYCAWM